MAGSTSTLTWNLVANSTAYVSGMQRAAGSTDKFKRALGDAEKQQRNLSRTILSAAVGLAVVRFGQQSVKAYAEAEKAQARLAEAYRKFPKLADASIDSLRDLNAELQRKTRFDDDATAAAQASLAMYDLTGQQIRELTPLVQDLAAATGGDVTDAADSLGKAFLGNARALKAVGIDFKATGDRAKDFETIMGALRTKVGGFAESEGKTASGQLAILNNAVGDLQESVGEALIPALTSLVSTVTPVVRAFGDLSPTTRTTAIGVTALGAAAIVATPRILALNTALKSTGTTLSATFGKAGIAAAAIGVVYALGEAAAKLDDALGNGERSVDAWGQSLQNGMSAEELLRIRDAMEGFAGTSANLRGALASFARGDVAGGLGAIRNGGEEVENFDAALAKSAASGNAKYVQAIIASLGLSAEDAAQKLPQATAALESFGAQSSWAAAQTLKVATEAADATQEVKTFGQALRDLNAPAADVSRSQIAVIESAKELAKQLRGQGASFSLSTAAGRANREGLIALTDNINQYGAAVEAKTGSVDKARAAVLREREALIKNLAAVTGSKTKAQELVDKYLKIPAAAKAAQTAVEQFTGALLAVPASVTVKVSAQTKATNINKRGRAAGGYISGPGTATSDSIPAMLSNGEYVIRASAVARHGRGFFDALNFADGGLVDTGFKGRRKKRSGKSTPKSTGSKASTRSGGGRDMSLRDSLRDDAGLLGAFDLDGYTAAAERAVAASDALKQAQLSVFEARRRANAAGSPAERAEAEAEVARALEEQAAAQREVAAANKAKAGAAVTGKNILAGFRARAAKLDKFRRDLKTLRSWGLSGVIIRQLVDAGIDDGGDMAAALVKDRSVIAELNATQSAIGADAAAINNRYGAKGSGGGSSSSGSAGTTGSNGSVAISFENASKPVVLKVDSEQVWKGLLRLKKSKGGASLGLS